MTVKNPKRLCYCSKFTLQRMANSKIDFRVMLSLSITQFTRQIIGFTVYLRHTINFNLYVKTNIQN